MILSPPLIGPFIPVRMMEFSPYWSLSTKSWGTSSSSLEYNEPLSTDESSHLRTCSSGLWSLHCQGMRSHIPFGKSREQDHPCLYSSLNLLILPLEATTPTLVVYLQHIDMDHLYHHSHGYCNTHIHCQILSDRKQRRGGGILLDCPGLLPRWFPSVALTCNTKLFKPLDSVLASFVSTRYTL